jgi:hypothetical protein
MILRILALKIEGPRKLDVTFNNGIRKRVDVGPLLEGPVFEPLRSGTYFAKAKLDSECGTVVWPNGADFAPETLLELPDEPKKKNRGKVLAKKAAARTR